MIYIPLSMIAIIVIVIAAIFYNLCDDLKEGSNFTIKEKRVLLKAIKQAREYYMQGNTNGLCGLLSRNIYNQGYLGLYKTLEHTYHTKEYYKSKGLKCGNYTHYWWPYRDIESRLKALDILEQAIIND